MSNSLESGGSGMGETGSSSPTWRWRLEDAAGSEVSAPDVEAAEFPSQSDAESWVGEVWRDLLESGVDAVTLFEGDRRVYGPMSLHST